MRNDVDLTGYNVTMFLQARGEAGRISGNAEDVMSDPLPVEVDGDQFVFASARDQMTLAFQPPNATLADVSGEWPTRTLFVQGLRNLIDQLVSRTVSVSAYAWNIEGILRNVDRAQVMGGLFDQSRIDRVLGGAIEPQWFVPQIDFVSSSTFSDQINLSLRHDPQEGEPGILHFRMSAFFEREIADGDGLAEQGREFTRNAEQLLARLTERSER